MRALSWCAAAAVLLAGPLGANSDDGAKRKWTARERQELIRALTAEDGNAKVLIPRSKKPLTLYPDGRFDPEQWGEAMNKFGPAGRLGDAMKITKIEFKGAKLVFEFNHGISGGRKWWHRVQVSGGGRRGTTLGQGQNLHAPGGTKIALVFEGSIPVMTAAEFKKLLKPVLDFEKRSATELYLEKIEPKVREAIENSKVLVGMDKDMVLLAKQRPDHKVRDFKDGIETEDWIYGKPPGDILFVTFNEDNEVIRVHHAHAQLGGQVHNPKPIGK